MNILLLSYGNESSIEIAKSINELNNHVVYGCHWDTVNAGLAYLNANYVLQIPNPYEIGHFSYFIGVIDGLIEQKNIDRVYVTNCKLLKLVFENYSEFKHIDKFLIPSRKQLEYCLYKDKLYELVPEVSPTIFKSTIEAIQAGVDEIFIKPKYGSSGTGTRLSIDVDEIDSLTDDEMACEYLPNEEFTVDCVSDSDGTLKDFNVRVRTRIRDGICNVGKSTDEQYDAIATALQLITQRLPLPHHWFAQFKLDVRGTPKLLEINSRISGSFCITKS